MPLGWAITNPNIDPQSGGENPSPFGGAGTEVGGDGDPQSSEAATCDLTIRDLIDGLPDGLIVLDRRLRLCLVSRRVEQILGPASESGQTLAEAWPLRRNTELEQWLTRMFAGEDVPVNAQCEHFFVTADGQERWIEIRVNRPGHSASGQKQLLHVHIRDITSRKMDEAALEKYAVDLLSSKSAFERQAEDLRQAREDTEQARRAVEIALEQAEQARQQAEQEREAAQTASRSKSAFLANMSHEIRTPMTAIVGYAEMMLEPGQTIDERRDCLHTIRRNARHLLELINDILDISKIEAGKMTVELIDTELPKVIAEVVSMMRPRCIEKGLDFQVSFEGPIPRHIRTDALRLRQILVNLLGNAIKFTDTGMVLLRVCCPEPQRREEGTTCPVSFAVTDTGIGISDAQLARLFAPFVQGDGSTTRKFGGTGLGLTISRRLSQMLGGDISVTSVPGKGSTFTLTIEAGDTSADLLELTGDACTTASLRASDPNASSEPVAVPACDWKLPASRILVVEDGKDNQKLIRMYLEKAGVTVEVADNGLLALKAVETACAPGGPGIFDLILMDMQMPELDGYGAASELRKRGVQVPIVALTAHAMSDDRDRCIAAGCNEYLTKPIERDQLLSVILRLLLANAKPTPEPMQSPSPEQPSLTTTASKPARNNDSAPGVDSVLRGEDPDMDELIDQFVQGLPLTVSSIRLLFREARHTELTRKLHQLKGAGGSYGFKMITTLAAEAESCVKNDAPETSSRIEVLVQHCRSITGYDHSREDRSEITQYRTSA